MFACLGTLDQHCQTLGRDPSQIRKTVAVRFNPLLDMDGFRSTMEQYAQLGVDLINVTLVGNNDPVGFVKRLGDDVVPLLAPVG